MKDELRELMHSYNERSLELQEAYIDAKDENNQMEMVILKVLQKQCRVMIAQLWHVMVKVGVLDEEEIKFGSIKIKK